MTKKEIIKIGKQVLELEANAVRALVPRLDENFAAAVELLARTRSRVIITGMGKSGLVGRKIASTLASCGTPALYIHPAEAGHGDLGMIVKDDILVIISHSGATREIAHLLEFAKRVGIKLIGITGEKKSRLAQYSDIILDTKVEREAGPAGIIPTASSTAALAMGDALAIALMKKKAFGIKDFVFFHPKGEAGKKLLKVSNLMRKGTAVPAVHQNASIKAVLAEISDKKLGMTCVVDNNGALAGIITDGDLRRALEKHGSAFLRKKAKDCMTESPFKIDKNDLATKALHLMEENKITSLIIQGKKGKPEGIIHLHDLWRTEMF
jgi:arabinose-5-phosphate isomerase